jgi:hypothetical protein
MFLWTGSHQLASEQVSAVLNTTFIPYASSEAARFHLHPSRAMPEPEQPHAIKLIRRSRPSLASAPTKHHRPPCFQMARACSAYADLWSAGTRKSRSIPRITGFQAVRNVIREISVLANLQLVRINRPVRLSTQMRAPAASMAQSGKEAPIIQGGRGFRAVGAEMSRLDAAGPRRHSGCGTAVWMLSWHGR